MRRATAAVSRWSTSSSTTRLTNTRAAAGAKAASGAGHDDRADLGIGAQALQRFAEALQHRRRERVQPIGAIEGQPGDAVFDLFQQVRHLAPPRPEWD